jgi:hypothetical protein
MQRDETDAKSTDFNDVRECLPCRLWRALRCIPVAILDIVSAYRLSKEVRIRGFFYSLNAALTGAPFLRVRCKA